MSQSTDTSRAVSAVVADRREFLRRAGLAGAALALVGCGAGAPELLAPSSGPRGAVVGAGGAITLDFSQDIDVLNYAYALEQLEAAFYIGVVTNGAFASVFTAAERRVLTDIRDHEVAHRDFFAAALGSARIPDLTPKFGAIDFADRTSVLQTARTFEDLGVSAYNGAARFIASEAYLGVAGKIVSVEARHASAIRDMLSPRSAAFAPDAFDAGSTPQDVLTAAGPFITESITVVNA